MEKNVEISILCDLYGKLLTEKQFEFINDYYNNDLSLSEIAENNDITRQAVRDIIKKGEKKLFEYLPLVYIGLNCNRPFDSFYSIFKKTIDKLKKIV